MQVHRLRTRALALALFFLSSFFTMYVIIGLAVSGPFPDDEYQILTAVDTERSIEGRNAVEVPKNGDVNALLVSSIRILCLCVTSSKYHAKRAVFVKATWGKRCTRTVFVSDEDDARLGAVAFSNLTTWGDLWAKTRSAFKWAHDLYLDDFDWFIKADDDTYLVVENLRRFLADYNPNQPHYMGRHFLSGDDPLSLPKKPEQLVHYASGGSAYVLSRKALSLLVEEAFQTPLYCASSGKVLSRDIKEDIEMGRCLASVGVHPVDTRDSRGRQRFNPFAPERHLLPGGVTDDDWILVHDAYRYIEGVDCCSDSAISFHYVPAGKMLQLEYLLYRLRPHGSHTTVQDAEDYEKVTQQLQRNDYHLPTRIISQR